MLFIWRHLEKFFLKIMMKVFCSGLSMYGISQIVLYPVWHKEMCEVLDQSFFFLLTAKQGWDHFFDLSVFWDVPHLKIAGLLRLWAAESLFMSPGIMLAPSVGCASIQCFIAEQLFVANRRTGEITFTTCCKFHKSPWGDPRRECSLDQCLDEDGTFHRRVRPPQFNIFFSPNAFVKTATLQTNKLLILEMFLCSDSQHWLFTQTTNKTCS